MFRTGAQTGKIHTRPASSPDLPDDGVRLPTNPHVSEVIHSRPLALPLASGRASGLALRRSRLLAA